jgi:acetyl esterase
MLLATTPSRAVVAQLSGTRVPRIHHQLLLYPVLNAVFDTASYREYATGYFLTRQMMRSEAEHYAQRLRQAGVRADVLHWRGQIHGFLLLQGVLDDPDRALATAALALRRAFAQPG